MKHRLTIWLIFFWLVTALGGFSQDKFLIYLRGNPFEGDYFSSHQILYLEKTALLEMLQLPENLALPPLLAVRQGEKTFIALSGLVKFLGASLLINRETGIIDLYFPHANLTPGPVIIIPPSSPAIIQQAPAYPVQLPINSGLSYCGYPYVQLPLFYQPILASNEKIHWSNGILPEDSQGHPVRFPFGNF